MPDTVVRKEELEQAMKEALLETVAEQRDVLRELVAEVLEDFALGEAMREGEATDIVDRERVFALLEGGS